MSKNDFALAEILLGFIIAVGTLLLILPSGTFIVKLIIGVAIVILVSVNIYIAIKVERS